MSATLFGKIVYGILEPPEYRAARLRTFTRKVNVCTNGHERPRDPFCSRCGAPVSEKEFVETTYAQPEEVYDALAFTTQAASGDFDVVLGLQVLAWGDDAWSGRVEALPTEAELAEKWLPKLEKALSVHNLHVNLASRVKLWFVQGVW